MKAYLVLAAAAALTAAPASSAVTFNLTNVTLVDGGTLTGTVTVSDNLQSLVDFSVTSNAVSSIYGNFAGRTYTLAGTSGAPFYTSAQGILANFTNPGAQLSLFFQQPLTQQGATFAVSSNETVIVVGGGTRFVTGGGLVRAAAGAVPEPATWAMMIGGFALVGAAMRRRVTVVRTRA